MKYGLRPLPEAVGFSPRRGSRVVGIFLLLKGVDHLVEGAVKVAHTIGLSEYVISATIRISRCSFNKGRRRGSCAICPNGLHFLLIPDMLYWYRNANTPCISLCFQSVLMGQLEYGEPSSMDKCPKCGADMVDGKCPAGHTAEGGQPQGGSESQQPK